MATYRIAILADIHGNLPAFEVVLHDLQQHGPLDAILVAGDMVGGPGQQAIIDCLLDRGALIIQGNGEQRVVHMANGNAPAYYATSHQFGMPRWVYTHLNEHQRAALCALPEQRVLALSGAEPVRMVHGSPRKIDDHVLPDRTCHPQLYYEPVLLEDIIDLTSEPVLVFGHTHLP